MSLAVPHTPWSDVATREERQREADAFDARPFRAEAAAMWCALDNLTDAAMAGKTHKYHAILVDNWGRQLTDLAQRIYEHDWECWVGDKAGEDAVKHLQQATGHGMGAEDAMACLEEVICALTINPL